MFVALRKKQKSKIDLNSYSHLRSYPLISFHITSIGGEEQRMDIQELSREELEELRVKIDKRLVELEKEHRAAALLEMRDIAKRHGVSLEEMMQMAAAGASPAGTLPKYRDPNNPANTWTGRGRKPKWLVAALDSGADIESFAI